MNAEKTIIRMDDVKPKTSRAKRTRNLLVLLCLLAIAAGIFLWFSYKGNQYRVTVKEYATAQVRKGQFVSTTEASGTVILPTQVEIVSPEDGYTVKLHVEEGDLVEPADVMVELEVPDLEDDLSVLTVDLEQAQIEFESLESEYRFKIEQYERDLLRLDADITEAEEDVQTMKELATLKSSRESDYEDALDTLEALVEKREDTQADLDSAISSRDISLRKQQAAINQFKVDRNILLKDMEEMRIKSPIKGEVLEINEDLFIPGSLIEQSDELFTVADRSSVYIDFDVYEQYVNLLEPGGEMTVTIGTSTMKAQILKVGKIATMDSDGLSAMISVRAEPVTDLTLTPGASAVATITLSVRNDVLLLPRGSWLTTGNQKYVYVVRDDRAYKNAVVLGEIQGTDVEILDGVVAGDTVITGSYQAYIDQDEIVLK
jgi:HlyD family secretion protein